MKAKIIEHWIRNKTLYKRLMKILLLIIVGTGLLLCLSFGKDKNGWYFRWTPAADIDVKVNK